jgi:hypothetical protein
MDGMSVYLNLALRDSPPKICFYSDNGNSLIHFVTKVKLAANLSVFNTKGTTMKLDALILRIAANRLIATDNINLLAPAKKIGFAIITDRHISNKWFYAPSGSGKTYFLDRNKEFSVIDGDVVIENTIGWPKTHRFWEKDNFMHNGDWITNNTFSKRVRNAIISYLRSNVGKSVLFGVPSNESVNILIPYHEHLSNLKSRLAAGITSQPGPEAIKSLRTTRSKFKDFETAFIRNGVWKGSGYVDLVMSVDDATDIVTPAFPISYAQRTMTASSLEKMDLRAATRVGSLMRYLTSSTRDISFGLGDKPHQVLQTYEIMRRKYSSVNLSGILESDVRFINDVGKPAEMVVEKSGQKKLKAVFKRFIMKFNPEGIISIGGAPGDSLRELSGIFRFNAVIIDPVRNNTNFETIRKFITTKNFELLIMEAVNVLGTNNVLVFLDIRRDKPVPFDQDKWQTMIDEDHQLMITIAEYCDSLGYHAVMKRRPTAFELELGMITLTGETYVPPFNNQWSLETWMQYGNENTQLSIHDYSNRVKIIRSNPVRDQDDAAMKYSVTAANYLPIIFEANVRGYYTLSNSINVPEQVLRFMFIQENDFYLNLTFGPQLSLEGFKKFYFDDSGHKDYLYEPNNIIHKLRVRGKKVQAYTTSDFAFLLFNKGSGRSLQPIFPANLTGIEAKRWFWLTTGQKTDEQTLVNSQTHVVKIITTSLREKFNLTNDSLHAVRRVVLREFLMVKGFPITKFGLVIKSYRIVKDMRVNGYVNGHPVAIAGHIINLLLSSSYVPIDIHRYMDTFETSLKRETTTNIEEGQDPWHSPLDLYLGLMTYIVMVKIYNLKINLPATLVAASRINYFLKNFDILRNNPSFY